jgi:hypothetical protein
MVMTAQRIPFQAQSRARSRANFQLTIGLRALFCFALIFWAFGAIAAWAQPDRELKIMTWADADTPDWDNRLHVTGIMIGCSSEPASCLKFAASRVAQRPGLRVFLSTDFKPEVAVKHAQEYSKLSLQNPFLQEIKIDDFVAQYIRLFSGAVANPDAMLTSMIDGVKSQNRALHFGITLYENEIDSPYLKEPKMMASTRSKVDAVHLFLVYREDVANYGAYVRQVKKMFPNAKVIAGAYTYDRISYISCSPYSSRKCSPAEEVKLFRQTLDTQIRMLKSGEVEWIEFMPGAFGREDEWKGWDSDPRTCPGRKQECIGNTKRLRQEIPSAFSREFGW